MNEIRNIYNMLSYTFQILQDEAYLAITNRELGGMGDLLASILSVGIKLQLQRGLDKTYVPQREILTTIRGVIDVNESIREFTIRKKKVACIYDEFSENTYMNQILKTAVEIVMHNSSVRLEFRVELKRLMLGFGDVDVIDLHRINWSQLHYTRSNRNYKMLMNISNMIISGRIGAESRMSQFIDNSMMQKLYTRFLLEYLRRHYPTLSVDLPRVNLKNLDEDTIGISHLTDIYISVKYRRKMIILSTPYLDVQNLNDSGASMKRVFLATLEETRLNVPDVAKILGLHGTEDNPVHCILMVGVKSRYKFKEIRTIVKGVSIRTECINLSDSWSLIETRIIRMLEREFGPNLNRCDDFGIYSKPRTLVDMLPAATGDLSL